MRAVVMHETGGPEVLKLEERPMPAAGPGQVVIRTAAIGVSRAEARMRDGSLPFPMPLPVVIGAEAAGVVTEVGAGGDASLLGATVAGVTGGAGSYAEYTTLLEAMLCRVPEGVEPVDACATAAPGAVALALLDKAGLTGGETVLVEGGASTVGRYLLAHAKELGAGKVIATAGAPERRERALEFGADVVVDRRDAAWPDALPEVDVVFESIGGQAARRVLDHLTPGTGRMLCYGRLSGEAPAVSAADLLERGVWVAGCGGPRWAADVFTRHCPEILARVADGRSRAYVEATLPLEEAPRAHRLVEEASAGRVLLIP
ncbi:quinone oxidoreductase family protein [Nonomuraea rhizosphaerae]|uniref:quinone oxidoreductase family protein n=1 Tax=Nonomuraea rhizosphaerae TaxID=2665663 RepID=UPI001C5D0501|nr:zinc-binding dehydrogenase [Nonomuraea rhizosphaerae]